jgi:hypothetical protein
MVDFASAELPLRVDPKIKPFPAKSSPLMENTLFQQTFIVQEQRVSIGQIQPDSEQVDFWADNFPHSTSLISFVQGLIRIPRI